MDYNSKIMISKHLTTLIPFFITLIITKNLVISLLIQLTIQILFLVLIEKKIIEKRYLLNRKTFVLKSIKKVILIGLPLGFVQMVFSFNTSFPRYLLEYFESTEILGYFSAISYILVIGNLMMNAITQNFLPFLSRKIHRKEFKSFKKNVYINLTLFSLGLGVLSVVISYFFGESFLKFVYGVEYAKYADILVLMSIALAINFVSWNFDTALMALRYISILPKLVTLMFFLTIFVGYFMIVNYGIYGATYTLITINLCQLILRAIFVELKINHISKHTNN